MGADFCAANPRAGDGRGMGDYSETATKRLRVSRTPGADDSPLFVAPITFASKPSAQNYSAAKTQPDIERLPVALRYPKKRRLNAPECAVDEPAG